MKSIPIPKILRFVSTPRGADYFTCPLCGTWSDSFVADDPDESCTDDVYVCHFCNDCGIVFHAGCEAIRRGCTDSDYNPIIIIQFTDEKQDIINEIPIFESYEEMKKQLPTLNPVLKCMCDDECYHNKIFTKKKLIKK